MSSAQNHDRRARVDVRKLTGADNAPVSVDLGWAPKAVMVQNLTASKMSFNFQAPAASATNIEEASDNAAEMETVEADGITIGPRGYSLGTAVQSDEDELYVVAFG